MVKIPEKSDAGNAQRQLHIVTQGKGGVGKTFVASLLCQAFKQDGRVFTAYDLDPVNRSLMGFKSLGAKRWDLMNEAGEIDPNRFDDLTEAIYKDETGNVVLDFGATAFVPLNNYIIENGVLGLLRDEGGFRTTIHCVIGGGGMVLECLQGMKTVCENYPSQDADIVIWLNGVENHIEYERTKFVDTKAYAAVKNRVSAVVMVPPQPNALFRSDLAEMLQRGQTFAEAIESADTKLVSKARLRKLQGVMLDVGRSSLGIAGEGG